VYGRVEMEKLDYRKNSIPHPRLKKAFNKALKEWGWGREKPFTKIRLEKEPRVG
jgi:hypothetical protein